MRGLGYPRRMHLSCPARGTWIEIPRRLDPPRDWNGRAPQGARGLKFCCAMGWLIWCSRAPQGARGLKSYPCSKRCICAWSCPARGTWIEIRSITPSGRKRDYSRAPQGARGLKFRCLAHSSQSVCRAPQGARGLKFGCPIPCPQPQQSCPARGSWIEIL